MHPPLPKKPKPSGWRERISALRNVAPLLRMVWETSAWLSVAVIGLRFIAALLPVAMLWISKLIVDEVVAAIAGRGEPVYNVWWLLGAEVALAVLSDALSRATALCDSLLGDRFTNHVSLRMMAHATQLDLVSFEDPVFYDKMERARRQTSSRLGMLASLASMAQQAITLLSLSVGIVAFSPWLLLLLIAAVIPPFLGETKFAMLAYSLLYQWTPRASRA